MELSKRLREATSIMHAQVEALPLAQAMAQGTIDRADYAGLLRRLLPVHRAWEAEVASHACLASIWSPDMARASIIEGDLEALGFEATPEEELVSRVWISTLIKEAETTPETWLGVIYLFEGSRMGSMALLKSMARALNVPPLPGHGLDYHLDGAPEVVRRWQRTKGLMDALPLTEEAQQAAISSALATFQLLHDLYSVSSGVPTVGVR